MIHELSFNIYYFIIHNNLNESFSYKVTGDEDDNHGLDFVKWTFDRQTRTVCHITKAT